MGLAARLAAGVCRPAVRCWLGAGPVSVWFACDRSGAPPGVLSRCVCEGVCGFEIGL